MRFGAQWLCVKEVDTMLCKKKKQPVKHDIQRLCDFAHQSEESNSDVLGSYTGTPKDGGKPVQDADDL